MILLTPYGLSPVSTVGKRTRVWSGGGAVPRVGLDLYRTYQQMYAEQPYLAAAVNKIAKGTARLPLKVYQHLSNKEEGTDRQRLDPSDPLAEVIRRPYDRMGTYRLVESLMGDLALHGNACALITAGGNGIPTEIFPVPWPLVEVYSDDPVKKQPSGYIFHPTNGVVPIAYPPERILHIRFWSSDPYNPLVAASPAEPLRRTLENEDAAARWSTAMFRNSGRPSGVVSTDQKLNDAQLDAVRSQVQQIYGGADNAFRVAVMQGGLTWQPIAFNAIETGLLELRYLHREEVAAAYDIPPPLLQDLRRATFSNIEEQHRMFYTGTIPPYLNMFEEEFLAQVIEPVPSWSDRFVEFDMNEVLKGDAETRARTYSLARRYMTIDEIRRRENLPPLNLPGVSDTVWEPQNEFAIADGRPLTAGSGGGGDGMVPTSTPQSGSGIRDTPSGSPGGSSMVLSALERAEQIGMSRLGGGGKAFDPERFARELLTDLGRYDQASKMWAVELALSVEAILADAKSSDDIRSRMGDLKAGVTLEPTSNMGEMGSPIHVHLPEVKVSLPDSFEFRQEPPVVNVVVDVPETKPTTLVELPAPKKTVRKVVRDKDSNIIEIREEESA